MSEVFWDMFAESSQDLEAKVTTLEAKLAAAEIERDAALQQTVHDEGSIGRLESEATTLEAKLAARDDTMDSWISEARTGLACLPADNPGRAGGLEIVDSIERVYDAAREERE